MNLILFDDKEWACMLPLTYTKSLSDIRLGIFSMYERWQNILSVSPSVKTQEYLQKKYRLEVKEENLFVNVSFFPSIELVEKALSLKCESAIYQGNSLVAFCGNSINTNHISKKVELKTPLIHLTHPWDLFRHNDYALKFDFALLIKNKVSQEISPTNGLIQAENIFLEQGAKVEYAILNATEGPIYIGKNAEIMEGAMIRGAFSLGEGSKINMGAKIYGATTIGPHCKIGGEVNNSIFFGYSNKAHDGFIGNSVIGEWCNLGADTNNSNLKNNYSEVEMWSIKEKKYISTELLFCGLIMGDHAKTAIDTKLNTGTLIGVSSNVFQSGFPNKYVPSFSWLGETTEKYDLNKAIEVAKTVMKRREIEMSKIDEDILRSIFEIN